MLPQKIGRYEILRELGRGGMATVYLARDPSFQRRVAVKVLPPSFIHTPEFRARFEREAQIIATLEHPYIVPVYDYGEDGDQPFLVMRFMPGGTLGDRIAGQPMPLAQIIPIVQRLAEALEDAHAQNIIHRDLKPANVMFDARNQAFLSDFGLAKLMEPTTTAITVTGVMGTPAYMSPEQALGDDLDGRSDVYSLGVVLYEMLTGRQPYEAKTPAAMMIKHVTVITPLIDTERLGLPADCNRILATALAKDRNERYATPNALADAVTALMPSQKLRAAKPAAATNRQLDANPTVHLFSSLLSLKPITDTRILALRRGLWSGALAGLLVLFLIGGYWWWTSPDAPNWFSNFGVKIATTAPMTSAPTQDVVMTVTHGPATATPAPPTASIEFQASPTLAVTFASPTIGAATAVVFPTSLPAPTQPPIVLPTATARVIQPTTAPTTALTTAPTTAPTLAPTRPPTLPAPTNPPPSPTNSNSDSTPVLEPSATPESTPVP